MSWKVLYGSKRIALDEAAGIVESGRRLYVSGNAATPRGFLRALAARAPALRDVELIHVLELGEDPFAEAPANWHRSLFVGPADRAAVNEGRAHYVPMHLHAIPRLFRERTLPIDIAVVHLSPPDPHGYLSLGVEVIASRAAIDAARCVLGIVNDQMPRTLGGGFVHVSELDYVVEVSEPLPELEPAAPGPVERRIGEHIAGLIEDGDTLQLGIGAIPDAVLTALSNHRDLGVHTEMVSDGVMTAIERGIITGSRKTLLPGKVVCSFVLGTRALYDYAHDNPGFELRGCDFTNDPAIVARNEGMVAINSAIEVDLTGQVCSDSIGTHIYSGFGGQLDFIRGAAAAPRGKPIIAMPATARGGEVSRIVPMLRPGAGVVTTRADVHWIVTEYGAVNLHGASIRERARALIDIAHPDFREDLERAAHERKLL